jgi:rod shape-determining protein MreC
MRNLLDFIIRNYFFFLFAILESIAITMFIQNNFFQRSNIINSTLELSGFFYQKYDNIAQYFSLKEANRKLLEENAKLRSKQLNSFLVTDNKTFYRKDTLYRQQYSYFGAKVINNSVNKKNNYLTLDKGTNQGVRKEMAVVSTTGIVGIVKDVSPNFSSVISVLHKESRISSKHKKSGQIGTVVWEEDDYRFGFMKDVPTHVKIPACLLRAQVHPES